MNKIICVLISSIIWCCFSATTSLNSTNKYIFTRPSHTNIVGKVIGAPADYRILRLEDISFLDEARAEIDLIRDYNTTNSFPIPMTNGSYIVDTTPVLKALNHQYTSHNVNTPPSDWGGWCFGGTINFFDPNDEYSGHEVENQILIDKGLSFVTGHTYREDWSYSPSIRWLYDALNLTTNDYRYLLPIDKLKRRKNYAPVLETITNLFDNIRQIQNCDTISMFHHPYPQGEFVQEDMSREKGIIYRTVWDGEKEEYVWINEPYNRYYCYTNGPVSAYLQFLSRFECSKKKMAFVYDYREGEETKYGVMYQENPTVKTDFLRHDYFSTSIPGYIAKFCRSYTTAGNYDRINSFECIAMFEIWKNVEKKSTVWDPETRTSHTTTTGTNDNYYITLPITLVREVQQDEQAWAWRIQNFEDTKKLFKSMLTDEEDIFYEDDYEENIKKVETPNAPTVTNPGPGKSGANENSISSWYNIYVHQIGIKINWNYTTTFE